MCRISIHTPTKGATVTYGKSGEDSTIFQSTLPRRERLTEEIDTRNVVTNFNPHSHEGSDERTRIKDIKNLISIHTPTKGATVGK